MNQQKFMHFAFITLFILPIIKAAILFNAGSTSYRNQTWMTNLGYGLPVRQISILGTRNSIQTMDCGSLGFWQYKQSSSIQVQLESGIRALDVRFKHLNNMFQLYDRSCNLGVNFDNVLVPVKNFLSTYSGETVLLHLVEEQGASGCTRTIQDTFIDYKNKYPGLFWTPTTQDPQLGQVRGKIVLLQQFSATAIHGLLWATFNVLPSKQMGTNWDLYDKWLAMKSFIPATNTAKKSSIAYWTGQGGSYPYFVVSGRASISGSTLWTGLLGGTSSGKYRDFPRKDCFLGLCSIYFQGMNIMGYNYIVSQGFTFTRIIYTDFYGEDLLKMVVNKNTALYSICTTAQTDQGCTLCTLNTLVCLKCNTNLHYIFDNVTKTCLAQYGYYLDINYVPQLCYTAIPGCLDCTNSSVCLLCDNINNYILSNGTCAAAPGYYLNASSYPVACPQVGCSQCLDAVVCTLCTASTNYIMDLSTNYTCKCNDLIFFMQAPSTEACICMPTYFLSLNNTCQSMPKCPDTTGGCLNCSGTTCLLCDNANHFIFDPNNTYCLCQPSYYFTGVYCELCNLTDAACDQCASASLCLSCVDNFTLTKGTCKCSYQYYLVDNNTCNLCSLGCLVCTGIGNCTICDSTNYFTLIGGFCSCAVGRFELNETCVPCGAMAGCIDCDTNGCIQCDPMFGFHLNGSACQCDYGYFVNDMNVCEKCMMDGCLNCLNQTQCVECNTTQFYLTSSGFCDDICGDGIKIYVPCDDGNTVDGDGCSSLCQVQYNYNCVGGNRVSPDVCSYSGPFLITVISTIKDQKQNKVYIKATIQPNILSLQNMNFSSVINPGFVIDKKSVTFNPTTGVISLDVSYNSSLNSYTASDLQVSFDPPTGLPQYFYMKTASFNLPSVTDNNLALKYYDEDIYGLLQIMKTLTNVTAFLYLGFFIICFLFVSKLIAIQLILVPQVTFVGLIMIQKLQALLQPVNNLYLTNGYNPLLSDNTRLPPRISILNFGGSFLTNFNVCLVVTLMPFIIGLSLYVVSKVQKKQKWQKYSYKALKQWLFSFLLLFQIQFTVSLGIDISYGQSMIGKAIGGFLIFALVGFLLIFYKKPQNFGQFKDYFEKGNICKNFYMGVVIFRILLAVDLVIMSDNNSCGFIAVGLCGVYTLVLLIIRPYVKNIRPIINMLVMIAILAIESIYKLNFYSSQTTFITSYLPLFVVGLLLLLLLINIMFMIFQIRQKVKKSQIDKYQKNADESFDVELRKELDRQMQVINQIQLALNGNNTIKIQERDYGDHSDRQRIRGYQELRRIQRQLNSSRSGGPLSEQQKLIYEDL